MVSMIYILFVCIVTPMLLMLLLLERDARLIVGFMIVGLCTCLFVSEVNGLCLRFSQQDMFYVTTTITPITEEIVKALPVLFFAFVFSDDRQKLLSVAMAVGIGFAILENAYILVSNIQSVSIFWAVTRGFGAGLMHGICTSMVGYGISFVRKKKKLFYTGTFALLIVAIIYHATYNCLVQASFKYVGLLLPLATYLPVAIAIIRAKRRQAKQQGI